MSEGLRRRGVQGAEDAPDVTDGYRWCLAWVELKNLWAQAREGSTPSPGTIRIRYLLNRLSSLRMFPVQNCARNVLTRFWERDDRARGEALDLMETRQLLATGDKISLRDDGIAAVDRLRLVPDHRDQTESMVVGGWNPDPRGS